MKISVLPAESNAALDGLAPSLELLLSISLVHVWLELSLDADLVLHFVQAVPELDMETSCNCGADTRDFLGLLPHNLSVHIVGLELHHEVVDGHASVHAHLLNSLAGVLGHRLDDLAGSQARSFEH